MQNVQNDALVTGMSMRWRDDEDSEGENMACTFLHGSMVW